MSISICSLNVNGVRDSKKRSVLFHWLKMQNFDLILLQETHCDVQNEKKWSQEWQGKTFWSHGNSSSRGVAILIKPNLDIGINNVDRDLQGRYICIDTKIDDLDISVINVYAPNNVIERKTFLKILSGNILAKSQTNTGHELIIAGDFNCAINPNLDRRNDKGQNTTTPDGGSVEIKSLTSQHSLEDVWRRRNPWSKKYTFQ